MYIATPMEITHYSNSWESGGLAIMIKLEVTMNPAQKGRAQQGSVIRARWGTHPQTWKLKKVNALLWIQWLQQLALLSVC